MVVFAITLLAIPWEYSNKILGSSPASISATGSSDSFIRVVKNNGYQKYEFQITRNELNNFTSFIFFVPSGTEGIA